MPCQKPMLRHRMVTTKWAYRKEWSFATNYFIFWKFCFSLRTSYKDLVWFTNNPNTHIRTFCKRWSFTWRYFFPVSILKKKCSENMQQFYRRAPTRQGDFNKVTLQIYWNHTSKWHLWRTASECSYLTHQAVRPLVGSVTKLYVWQVRSFNPPMVAGICGS